MINGKKIIVVFPAYNAAKTLKKTLDAIPKGIVDDMILVDDASKDNTVEVAKGLGLKSFVHLKNRGYGGNQKTCYRESLNNGADIVVMVHPDFQYDPSFIPEMIQPIAKGECAAVFGSRMLVPKNAIAGGMPYWKFIANIFLTKLENFVLGMDLTEYHSGFRAYGREALERLPIELNSDGFVFDTEIIVQMRAAGLKIKEIPISTRYFPEASMIGFLRSTEYGLKILLVMARYLLHKFRIKKYSQLIMLLPKSDLRCINCGERRVQLAIQGTVKLKELFKTAPYSIIDFNNGKFENIYRCVHCDSYFVDRSRLEEDLSDYYKNQILDTLYLVHEKGRRKVAARILRQLLIFKKASPSELKILDIGCGPGIFLSEAKKGGWQIFGIELSVKNVDFARNNFQLPTVTLGSAEEAADKFEDSFFDVITAFDVVERLFSPWETLGMIRKKMKPGGILVVSMPLIDSLIAYLMGGQWHALVPSHLNYFTEKSLKFFFESLGYKLIYRRSYTRYLTLDYLIKRLFKINLAVPKFLNFTLPVSLSDEAELYFKKD